MFEDTITKLTACIRPTSALRLQKEKKKEETRTNPTDWQLTNQNDTRRDQTMCRGRYAMHAAATTQMMLAAVEARRRAR
jgi:hypothetical protein